MLPSARAVKAASRGPARLAEHFLDVFIRSDRRKILCHVDRESKRLTKTRTAALLLANDRPPRLV